jgi:acetylornithine aminotransferase
MENEVTTLMANYGRAEIQFSRGEGAYLYTADEEQYLDALSGIAVCSLGHANPEVGAAISKQAMTLLHTSNLYRIKLQENLSDRLTSIAGMENAFFCNSGAEANEAAIKIARKYGHTKGIACPSIVTMNGSFHGRTMATLSATGNSKVHEGFEPLVPGFKHVNYNDIEVVADALQDSECVAVMVEPIQGEGGVVVPNDNYLRELRRLCDVKDVLLIVDEVQSGIGRTGEWFAYQHEDILPDVVTSAKALGNGVPIGACLARGVAATILSPGTHGSTFGGNPLACSAALAVLDVVSEKNLLERSRLLGQFFVTAFHKKLASRDEVLEVRGKGLMVGIELDRPCGELVKSCSANGVLINVAAQNVVRLLPPLIISDDQATEIVEKVSASIFDFLD